MRTTTCLALLLAGCAGGPGGDPTPTPTPGPTPAPSEGVVWGEERPCASPTDGWDRFTDEAASRGLTEAIDNWGTGGPHHVVAEDLDDDGDVDLAWWNDNGRLQLFHNDGAGHFSPVADDAGPGFGNSPALLALQLIGDPLPDLVVAAPGAVVLRENLGGTFGPFRELRYAPSDDSPIVQVLSAGDVDGDGDLDLLAPGLFPAGAQPGAPPEGTADTLLLLQDGDLDEAIALDNGEGTIALVSTLTDYDDDGDLDPFVPSDLRLPAALWRNDGGSPPSFTDVGPELGAAVEGGYMALDGADLNGDGRLDYCLADTTPPTCLASTDDGFLRTEAAWGMSVDEPVGLGTIGWGFDFADLDGDGWLDAVQVAGAMLEADAQLQWQDLVWAGGPGPSFDDVSVETGIDSTADHYGQVVADLDEDGWLDVLVLGPDSPPRLWMNACGDGDWIEVELQGPAANPQGIGAKVQLDAGEHSMLREVSTARGMSQGPSRVHFTYAGEASSIEVRWPDGERTRIEELWPRRKLRVAHPDAG